MYDIMNRKKLETEDDFLNMGDSNLKQLYLYLSFGFFLLSKAN